MTEERELRGCLAEGCQILGGLICNNHWFKLPMAVREKWWKETNYGKKEPSKSLVNEVQRELF